MKKTLLISGVLVIAASFLSFRAYKRAVVSGILEQLGIEESAAKENAFRTLTSDVFAYVYKPEYKEMSAYQRAQAVRELGAWAKAYTRTQEFKSQYAQLRDDSRPDSKKAPKSANEELEEQKKEMDKSIKELEYMVYQVPASQRQEYRDAIAALKHERAQLDDPKNEKLNKEQLEQVIATEQRSESEIYQDRIKVWMRDFPTNSDTMVKRRLHHFLEASANIDFNAELKKSGRKMIFVNPDYEKKPNEWKQCYRSGKDAVDAAREFAKTWIRELK